MIPVVERVDEPIRTRDQLMSVLYGVESAVLFADCLHADFFDLRTGVAGDLLQLVVNHRCRLAIVGAPKGSDSFEAFVREANRGRDVCFVSTKEEALARLQC